MDGFSGFIEVVRVMVAILVAGLPDALAVMTGLLLTFIILVASTGKAGRILVRSGRRSGTTLIPELGLVVIFLWWTANVFLLAFFLAGLPVSIFVLVDFTGSALLAGLSVMGVVASLPPRRRTGPNPRVNRLVQRFFAGLGWLIMATGLAAGAGIVFLLPPIPSDQVTDWFETIAAAIAILALLLMAGGHVVAGSRGFTPGYGTRSTTPPVFFIRPFNREYDAFDVAGRNSYEGFLGSAIESKLGPLVALGNPTERIPGPARTYLLDAEWQSAVERIAKISSCILAVPGDSASTMWEITYLKNSGQQRKLFVLTPPYSLEPWQIPADWTDRVKARLVVLVAALFQGRYRDLVRIARIGRLPDSENVHSWRPMAASLAQAGYEPGIDPGAGSVLTFDGESRAVILKQRATKVAEYIATIGEHLKAIDGDPASPESQPSEGLKPGSRLLDIDSGSLVQGLAFSPDGHHLATATFNKAARIWDASNGDPIMRIQVSSWRTKISVVAFSPDGTRLATGGEDRTARIWDAATGTQMLKVRHGKDVTAVAFSPDGTRIATGSYDDTARIWDATTGVLLQEVHGGSYVSAVTFSPEGARLATGSWDFTARIWDAATGTRLLEVRHDAMVYAVAFSPGGTRLATGSYDKTAKIWDAASGEELMCIRHDEHVNAVVFNPDGTRLATGSSDSTARIWDAATGKLLLTLGVKPRPYPEEVRAVAFSPDGTRLATNGAGFTARIWAV